MVAGARNHLQANTSLKFRFEVAVKNPCFSHDHVFANCLLPYRGRA
jgi:hypothetical protein